MTQEGLFSVFILLSLLSLLAYLLKGRQLPMLLLAGAAAGLAALTKSPGIILIPFTGLLLFLDLINDWRSQRERSMREKLAAAARRQAQPFLLWSLSAVITYFALWPAMWVAPLETFQKVYGAAANYVTTGGKFNTPDEGYSLALLRFNPAGFLNGLLWHTTPAQWAGFLLAAFSLPALYRRKDWLKFNTIAAFTLFAALFILMMSATRSASYTRYIMSAFLSLDIITALGIAAAADWVRQRFPRARGGRVFPALAVVFLTVQAFASTSAYPYYFNYYNPLLGGGRLAPERTMVGYGEVLDQAGRYLSQKPNAEELSAMSWFPVGPFSYFFAGETEPIFVGFQWTQEKADVLKTLDYLLIYVGNDQRGETRELVASLEGVTPAHIIVVNEIEYVKIYKVSELPDEVFVVPET
jgi:4-amino-4-deoxy-L-arabinose transferase-like glycosyltransferase